MADLSRVAVVLAAHGDRGSLERNAVLRAHAERLRDRARFGAIFCGVLNGEPALVDVLREAGCAGPDLILVYPFFMSGGYFVKKVLPERIAEAGIARPHKILEPLGLDPALPGLLLRLSLQTAGGAGFSPAETRLLVAAHGSKIGRTPAETAEAIARAIRVRSPFKEVTAAFIEEPPFIAESLRVTALPTVVAGLFSGDGMHGHDDVGEAIKGASAPCAYTRPAGSDPEVAALIEALVLRALGD
jgi:sirohydrochlorin cobaltochelatase